MAIEAEALLALSEMASQGEWSLGKAEGGYRFLDAAGIPSKPGPDRNVKWSGFARFVFEMEDDTTCSGRSNLEFVAALVNAYRAGSLIHRSALAEDTARAAEGWPSIDSAPQNGAPVWGICMEAQTPKPKITWWANGWHTVSAAEKFAPAGPHKWWPTHWTPLEAPTRLPSKEAADANR